MDKVWEIFLLIVGVIEVWSLFVEPSIKEREDALAKKRREQLEHRRNKIKVDLEELEALQKFNQKKE